MIPAEAVEAAAKVYYEASTGKEWAMLNNFQKPVVLSWMHLALEAAAPHMLAGLADSRDGDLFRFTWAQREWLRGGGR